MWEPSPWAGYARKASSISQTLLPVPVSIWFQQRIQQQQHRELSSLYSAPPRFPFEMALARLLTALFLLLIAFALLRWLYYPAAVELGQEQSPDPEQEA